MQADPDQGGEPSPTLPSAKMAEGPTKEHLQLYGAFRDYSKHEDDLTNNRLNWNFTIQGFLFFSWAYCLQKLIDLRIAANATKAVAKAVSTPPTDLQNAIRDLQLAMVVIGGVGLAVSLLVFLGACGAQIAILKIRSQYQPPTEDSNTHETHLPGLIGGGSDLAHFLGVVGPLFIPIIFALAWLILLLYARRLTL